MALISISIVTYHPDLDVLGRLFEALDRAAIELAARGHSDAIVVSVIDNSVDEKVFEKLVALLARFDRRLHPTLERMSSNLGYGRAHNHCLLDVDSTYHLVLNPDVLMRPDALVEAILFLEAHPEVGLLTPRIFDEHGEQSYAAKRVPKVADLLLRGFAPAWLRKRYAARLDLYEMRDKIADDPMIGVPIASGCFMFFRTATLQRIGGFDPRYFMYFEDYDLCLRLHGLAEIAYVPSVNITHFGGDAAKKGWLHIRLFAVSAFRFFSRWGWRWF